jgi:hypothetical protein
MFPSVIHRIHGAEDLSFKAGRKRRLPSYDNQELSVTITKPTETEANQCALGKAWTKRMYFVHPHFSSLSAILARPDGLQHPVCAVDDGSIFAGLFHLHLNRWMTAFGRDLCPFGLVAQLAG